MKPYCNQLSNGQLFSHGSFGIEEQIGFQNTNGELTKIWLATPKHAPRIPLDHTQQVNCHVQFSTKRILLLLLINTILMQERDTFRPSHDICIPRFKSSRAFFILKQQKTQCQKARGFVPYTMCIWYAPKKRSRPEEAVCAAHNCKQLWIPIKLICQPTLCCKYRSCNIVGDSNFW
jgi:hypothetical protein